METRINVAELLKNCPKGMELYSTIYGTVYFEGVRDTGHAVLIDVKTSCNTEVQFYSDGKFNTYYSDSEMTLFPSKDVRTWEGFIPPCKFKEGDVVCTTFNSIAIIKDKSDLGYTVYCALREGGDFYLRAEVTPIRLATEEEKQKLLQVIKKNGYKWNAEKKCLEKLIEPKFKVGDRIQYNGSHYKPIYIIKSLGTDRYIFDNDEYIKFVDEDNYSLLKFDISTLKPFDKVLVKDSDNGDWSCDLFSHYRGKDNFYAFGCISSNYRCCIPYEENKHLLGTNNDCDEFYKNWE